MEYAPYNPLDKLNLGNSVAEAMLETRAHPLGVLEPFTGAGIYAVYYTGKFAPYLSLSAANRQNRFSMPIYVGKAVPPGARKGNFGLDSEPGQALYRRLKEHAESVMLAENLNIEDF